jgi:hypothetical protein
MFHIDSQLSLEDFHPDVRRCAHTGRAESDGTGSSARERDQLSEIRESSVAPGDQHVGLLRQRCDRDEVLEGIVWEIERERRTVRVGARAHEHRMAVRWRCRHHGRTYRASRTGLVLQRDGMSPSVGKGAGEGAPDEVGAATGAERLDELHRAIRERVHGRRQHVEMLRQQFDTHDRMPVRQPTMTRSTRG